MISFYGTLLLYLALATGLIQLYPWLRYCNEQNQHSEKLTKFATDLSFIFLSFAVGLLIYGFFISEFSLAVVAANSQVNLSTLYKICALWASHEGSLLFWIWLLSLLNIAFLYLGNFSNVDKCSILSFQSLITISLIAILLFTSNPFAKSTTIFSIGLGLNPLLQDIAMLFHPPILYIGMVGFSLPYSMALAALQNEQKSNIWIINSRPWIMLPWTFLTAGIGLGSWWAYRELGWGGYWFWDPVENIALIPWLVATALIHVTKLAAVRNCQNIWVINLSTICFLLTILGTYLVRSNLLTSIHSFAIENSRSALLLIMFAVFTLLALTIFLKKYKKLSSPAIVSFFSRDGSIIINITIMIFIATVVLAGIIYPPIYAYLTNKIITVKTSYYETALQISILPVLIATSLFSFLKWNKDSIESYVLPWIWLLVASALLVVATCLFQPINSYFVIAVILAAYFLGLNLIVVFFKNIIVAASYFGSTFAMFASHFGLVLVVIAITLNSTWEQEITLTMKEGSNVEFAKHTIKLEKISYKEESNYYSRTSTLIIISPDKGMKSLYPETRFYKNENKFTSESAILRSYLSDLYVTMGELLPGGKIILSFQYKPLINLLWLGWILVFCGGAISLTKRRLWP